MPLRSSFLGAQRFVQSTPAMQPQSVGTRSVTCMAKKKGIRLIVTIECTEARQEGSTPSRYTTQKSKKNTPARLELMKYNKHLRKMTLHREIKS
ncbi:hypothetical protein Ndes2526B_g02827 [Nannochloris sp. 'desiccata']|nr:hypothetical protein KSW81_006908 [Chlorella desiccata (nom. nud.)]KAH7622002.1 putative 50S ribosomal protein L33 [Chlorella desiccata (nom. nud.)]